MLIYPHESTDKDLVSKINAYTFIEYADCGISKAEELS